MKSQILELQKANRDLKDSLQDAVMLLRNVDMSNWGVIQRQSFALLNNKAFGTPYNDKDWCFDDLNGEQ